MTDREALKKAEAALSAVTDEARFEAELLLSHITGRQAARIRLDPAELDPERLEALDRAVERRLSREPLQYVLGEWYFMGLTFSVSPAALIPRQDTETLCEEALRLIRERGYRTLLDICTGTGCIAISLKSLCGIETAASDISPEALALARENAAKNGAEISFFEADLFEGLGKYDIVTANPPYISDADMAVLQEEVHFEPALALEGGPDGLDLYRRIAEEAPAHINKRGALLMEVGIGEAEAVAGMFPEWETSIIKDLNGIDRIVRIDF